jgi:hypothetical protein
MDKNLQEQLHRIENKLDLILKTFSPEIKNTEVSQEPDQYYFPWYHECKAAVPSDILM